MFCVVRTIGGNFTFVGLSVGRFWKECETFVIGHNETLMPVKNKSLTRKST